jgi:F-type H+-transporting ATPase subunit alpha
VAEFNEGLVERLHADASDTLKKIADGDWSDETQSALRSSIEQWVDDFGYDLDEEGQPLSEEDTIREEEGRRKKSDQDDGDDDKTEEREDEPVGAEA